MSFRLLIFSVLLSFHAQAKDCELQAQRRLPEVIAVTDGDAKDWDAGFGHDYADAAIKVKRLRGTIFKLGRIKKKPLFSTTYLALNGETHSLYFPNKKTLEDVDSPVFGTYPEDLSALIENYKLMQAYYGDRLKNSGYFRLRKMYFASLKNPFLIRIWKEVYRKTEVYALKNGDLIVRAINTAIAQVRKGDPELFRRVRMGGGQQEMKKVFDRKVKAVFIKRKIPIEDIKAVIEVFHERLVETVNKQNKAQFRFMGRKNLKKGGIAPLVDPVRKYVIFSVVAELKRSICKFSGSPLVFVMIPQALREPILKKLKEADDRLKIQTFVALAEEDRRRLYKELLRRNLL